MNHYRETSQKYIISHLQLQPAERPVSQDGGPFVSHCHTPINLRQIIGQTKMKRGLDSSIMTQRFYTILQKMDRKRLQTTNKQTNYYELLCPIQMRCYNPDTQSDVLLLKFVPQVHTTVLYYYHKNAQDMLHNFATIPEQICTRTLVKTHKHLFYPLNQVRTNTHEYLNNRMYYCFSPEQSRKHLITLSYLTIQLQQLISQHTNMKHKLHTPVSHQKYNTSTGLPLMAYRSYTNSPCYHQMPQGCTGELQYVPHYLCCKQPKVYQQFAALNPISPNITITLSHSGYQWFLYRPQEILDVLNTDSAILHILVEPM